MTSSVSAVSVPPCDGGRADLAASFSGRDEYYSLPGLSASGMKDLEVSPLRYWYKHVNPERIEEPPTAAMRFGTALHCAVLEPDKFDQRYARELDPQEHDGCLFTIEEMRSYLRSKGFTPKGTRKAEVIAQVASIEGHPPIYDVIESEYKTANTGKEILTAYDWARLAGASQSLRSEPEIDRILSSGSPEVTMFAIEPETKVLLKAKMDWVSPICTMDVKTFTQQRGQSIDRSIANAIYYEKYYRQGYFYSLLRAMNNGGKAPEFILPFVESEAPYETRLRSLTPRVMGEANLYWEKARIETEQLIRLYARCMKKYGESPWRDPQEVSILEDQEIPALAYN